jgi:predicted transcriptional regulator
MGGVAIMIVKDQILKVIQELPQDATVEDAMERLYLLYKVERGIEQAEAGQKITQEEARKRMAKWLE